MDLNIIELKIYKELIKSNLGTLDYYAFKGIEDLIGRILLENGTTFTASTAKIAPDYMLFNFCCTGQNLLIFINLENSKISSLEVSIND